MEVWDTSIASDRSRHLLGSAQRRVERDQNWQALRQVLITGTDDGTGWFEAWLTSVYDGARHAGNCIVEEMQTEGRLWWTAMQHPLPVLKDAGLGLLQGTLNTLNGAQDSIIGMLNLGIQHGPFGAVVRDLRAFGIDLTLPSPDWSRDLVIDESDRSHWWSKFLGGEGLVILATLGVGELAEAARAGGAAARGGFGAIGLYRPPVGTADATVRAAYLTEVDSLSFRIKLGIHNILTPFHSRTTMAAVREVVESGAFGRGSFTVRMFDDGHVLFGGRGSVTFLNRQNFHHELIHVSQMIKNPNLWREFPLRTLHEFVELPTAHGATFWPAAILAGWWVFEQSDAD